MDIAENPVIIGHEMCGEIVEVGADAGDSSLAGVIAAAQKGKNAADCLKTAVAYGTAACLTAGTLPPRKEDLERMIPLVAVKKI